MKIISFPKTKDEKINLIFKSAKKELLKNEPYLIYYHTEDEIDEVLMKEVLNIIKEENKF